MIKANCLIRKLGKLYLLGLFLLTINTYSQKSKEVLWDSIRKLTYQAYELSSINLDSAETILLHIDTLIKKPYDSLVLSDYHSVWGNFYFNKNEFTKSLNHYQNSLEIRELIADTAKIATSLNSIGNVYYLTNAYDKALEYNKKSIGLYRKINTEPHVYSRSYNVIALIYSAKGEYDSAQKYVNFGFESLKNAPPGYEELKADLYGNIGALFYDLNQYDLAIENIDSALTISKRLGKTSTMVWSLNKLGNVYLEKGEFEKAYRILRKADSLSKQAGSLEIKKEINYSLFKYYLLTLDKDSASKYILKYNWLNDSIISLKTKQNIQEMEAKYQLGKTEAALALSEEKAARLNAEKRTNQYYLYFALASILVLLLILFISYRYYQHKRKLSELELEIKDSKLDELLSNQESKAYASILKGQEKERERIAQDLHDRLGGTLAALKLAMKKPNNKIDPEDMKIIDEAILDVRGIAHNLSTGLVQKYGLSEALNQLFRSLESSGGIKFSLYIHPKVSTLGQAVVIELYRITQELVSNTLKHAAATEVSLQTNFDIGSFNFIFEDNGKGFEEDKVKGGIGLENIKARVEKLGGDLHIDTKPGRGTIVIVELKYRP